MKPCTAEGLGFDLEGDWRTGSSHAILVMLIGLLDDLPDLEAGMAQLLPHETECTDVTARRVHQFGVVALAATGTALAWASPEVPAGPLLILAAAACCLRRATRALAGEVRVPTGRSLVLQAPCPSCAADNSAYFGDILGVVHAASIDERGRVHPTEYYLRRVDLPGVNSRQVA